jgi:hypothetical protein
VYIAEFKEGMLHGPFISIFADGLKYSGVNKDNVPHGEIEIMCFDGTTKKQQFEKGI